MRKCLFWVAAGLALVATRSFAQYPPPPPPGAYPPPSLGPPPVLCATPGGWAPCAGPVQPVAPPQMCWVGQPPNLPNLVPCGQVPPGQPRNVYVPAPKMCAGPGDPGPCWVPGTFGNPNEPGHMRTPGQP